MAELESVLPTISPSCQIIASSPDVVIFDSSESIDASTLILRLGGTIKIGVLLNDSPINMTTEALEGLLLRHLTERYGESTGRITIGFSVSSLSQTPKKIQGRMSKLLYTLRNNFLSVKKQWRAEHDSLRIVTPQKGEPTLSSVVVTKNHLTTSRGTEFLFLIDDSGQALLARTLAVQPFEAYTERDFGRPAREMTTGLLPPKLAQVMINLAQHPPSDYPKIWDPFCGFGTIVQEALLMGYRDVHGSDISPARMADTRANLEWLAQQLTLTLPPLDTVLHHHDATMPAPWPEGTIDAIITEGYLGPVIHHTSSPADIAKATQAVEKLYRAVFPHLHCTLKVSGAFVLTLPVWFTGRDTSTTLPLESLIKDLFSIQSPISTKHHPWLSLTSRKTIIYHRPGQLVGREIVILKKLPTAGAATTT